jgi:hypothetical protein
MRYIVWRVDDGASVAVGGTPDEIVQQLAEEDLAGLGVTLYSDQEVRITTWDAVSFVREQEG